VEFSDYQCPYCSRAETTVQEVLKKYGDKVRLVYRDYPLQFHPNANIAAQASECAKDQGKFWEMHNAMFANQAKLTQPELVETAATIAGIDKDKFKTCLDSGKFKDEVQKDFRRRPEVRRDRHANLLHQRHPDGGRPRRQFLRRDHRLGTGAQPVSGRHRVLIDPQRRPGRRPARSTDCAERSSAGRGERLEVLQGWVPSLASSG